MATQQRPYQGYPYTNPHVTDVPSIDAATASRWADLPRRPQRKNVVYVDIPEDGSQVSESSVTESRQDKKDLDAIPVIYIDVPESGSSSVAEPLEPEAAPEYVQDTIFYNPFDNRRIDQQKDEESGCSSDSVAGSSRAPGAARPTPPSTLDLASPGTSGYSSNYTTPGLPPSMSKEAYIYQAQDNRFPASPIPVSEFPQPPPAYTEIEAPVGGSVGGQVAGVESPRSPAPSEPPRTVVITPGSDQRIDEPSPIGLPNPFRKVVYCQHCGRRVHTLVIRQTGRATHIIALSFLCVGLFPITILVYLTDTCKDKNHYCPNCNKLIGYEVPVICQNMTYTRPG